MSKKLKKEISFTWFIPAIKDVCDSQVDEMNVTIKSLFKVQLNFTKKAEDELNLFVLPLIPLASFKFSLTQRLNKPERRQREDIDDADREIVSLPEVAYDCSPPVNWINCAKMSIKQIKRKITTYYNVLESFDEDIDCMGINLEIKFSYASKMKKIISNTALPISNDYEELFLSGQFNDAVIKTNEGKEIKVHKCILAVRCQVLNSYFQHDSIESATNIVEAPFDNETMENLLLYIYCHKTPKIDVMAEKLLVAADYYQLVDLKNKCAETLLEQLSAEKVVERLELALRHSCTILEEGVLNYINDKSIANIVQSEEWLQTTNVEVFKKICEHFVVIFNKNK